MKSQPPPIAHRFIYFDLKTFEIMEDLVQRITIKLKTNMKLVQDPTEAAKAIEEEVLSLIRSGQVIEVRGHQAEF